MGSSGSKAARTTAASTARKYPQRKTAPIPSNVQGRPVPSQERPTGPIVHPRPQASGTKDQAIDLDARDPDFASSLRALGSVQPTPTYSPSSTFNRGPVAGRPGGPSLFPDAVANPAVALLKKREEIAHAAEEEFLSIGRRGHTGRRFLDVTTIRQILTLRDQKGVQPAEIERRLGLQKGVTEKLGGPNVVQSPYQ
ncbi:hypothetical protein L228DRAFT_235283 [Xylona heveae TC161]|uniref:Helix-turn-helix domain-containing protein n=1 Tax=Xylona heveae (strain CBS 132557 / TC161) TaxID=1328760 RepID=A0A165JFX2_XYLHT|nr:hypothetical protein L228DRAFT_235283 [Xylona heveae TC161]KZF26181.1 hypothetical protein L228DRAFT_235283 [Xylona heveae TC161]